MNISLRDYFAAKAMQGMMPEFVGRDGNRSSWMPEVCKYAYETADLMLKEGDLKINEKATTTE